MSFTIPPGLKQEFFSFRTMAWKATKRLAYYALGAAFFGATAWLTNGPAVTAALKSAHVSEVFAGVISAAVVWLTAAVVNYVKNHKLLVSPVDGQPVNAQAIKGGPVLQTQEQWEALIAGYTQHKADGVPWDEARVRALADVTGAPVKP